MARTAGFVDSPQDELVAARSLPPVSFLRPGTFAKTVVSETQKIAGFVIYGKPDQRLLSSYGNKVLSPEGARAREPLVGIPEQGRDQLKAIRMSRHLLYTIS